MFFFFIIQLFEKTLSLTQKKTYILADVKKLIANKQLEIVVGSWIVPDEANPHYYAPH